MVNGADTWYYLFSSHMWEYLIISVIKLFFMKLNP